jgi:ATP-dependent helicase/nuclease subunit A
MLNDQKARNLITCDDAEGFKQLQFVKAGAGAGKTTSIKLRVLNLIKKKNLIPERMVTITYTTKAANELMTKIREILEKELKEKDLSQEDRPKIEAALATLAYGKISTFHSFCYDLLREYPVEFGVDPDAEIGDERGQDTIYQACFDQMCEELLIMKGHPKEAALKIFEELRELSSDKVIKEFFVILFANRDLQAKSVVMTQDKSEIHEQLMLELGKYLALATQIEDQVKDTGDAYYTYYYEQIKPFVDCFKTEKGHDMEAMAQAFLDEEEAPFKASKGAKGKYKDQNYIPAIKDVLKECSELYEIYQAVNKVYSYNLCVQVFPYFNELVQAYKQNYGILDFFDCLHKVKNGLEENTSLRELIQKRFDTIIVDEFQDSDPMQVAIAFMLAEDDETKLFFVGDPKQSIYGFARADIAVYQKVMETIETNPKGKILNLCTNFRSAPAILDFINDNFKQLLLRDTGFSEITVDYDQMDVCPDNKPLKGSVTKWSLEMETDANLLAEKNRERESFVVGMKIKEMIEKGYKPGDFLILFRTGTAMGAFEDALEKLRIPVVNTKSKDFLSKSEVIDMLNIISHVTFPTDAYFKACAEQSPLYKVASHEAFQSILDSEMSLILKLENIFNLCELKESSLQYEDPRLINLKVNLLSLLEVELDSTEYNLKATIKNLYEKATTDSFISSIKLNDESIYLETRTPNAVRLMTVHASKGLESKVVILATHSQTKDMGGCHFINRAVSLSIQTAHSLSEKRLIP